MMRMRPFKPTRHLNTIRDGRGACPVFPAITDCEPVSFLTEHWDASNAPIIRQSLGPGSGDPGDPQSPWRQAQNPSAESIP